MRTYNLVYKIDRPMLKNATDWKRAKKFELVSMDHGQTCLTFNRTYFDNICEWDQNAFYKSFS